MRFKRPKEYTADVFEIHYHSQNASGILIIEKNFYMLNMKKIDKLLKDTIIDLLIARPAKETDF